MPLSSTHALKADSVGPALRTNGNTLPVMNAFEPTSAPPSTRPWPSRNLVAECITTSAPSLSGC